jgi:hypothetical protein
LSRSLSIKALKLPDTVSKEERLGLLKPQGGFEINDAREIIKMYSEDNQCKAGLALQMKG